MCSVHSSSLAFKDVCNCVTEIKTLISELASLATYFHTSARRTAELEQTGSANGLKVRRLPTYYEVRWAEFSESLIVAVLQSWQALVLYFATKDVGDAANFRKSLTNADKVKLMCFVADLLFLLSNFQKTLQSDSLTILDIKPKLETFQKKLDKLTNEPLIGGWEETLSDSSATL